LFTLGYNFFPLGVVWGTEPSNVFLGYFRTTRCYLGTGRGGKLNFKTEIGTVRYSNLV